MDENILDNVDFQKYIGPYTTKSSLTIFKLKKDSVPWYNNIKISLINSGKLFGIEDVMNNRNYSVTVTFHSSSASCYIIPAVEFFNLV